MANNIINPSVGGGGSGINLSSGTSQFLDVSYTTASYGNAQYVGTRMVNGGGINFWADRRDMKLGPAPSGYYYNKLDRRFDQKTYYTT